MTRAQKEWLDRNPGYGPLVQAGGMVRYARRGMLMPDGTFVPATPTTPIVDVPTDGSFGVGVREVREPGRGAPADPRGDLSPRKVG